MCGIIGIVSHKSVSTRIVECLRRLEYRGYDSTGVATLGAAGEIECRRAVGKIVQLETLLNSQPLTGGVGIGHTRWATHGAPLVNNAHPLNNGRVAVVHNGIIENYTEIKAELIAKGHTFTSETDTETVVHLVSDYLEQGLTPKDAAFKTLSRLEGAFAIALLIKGEMDLLIGARRGSPLAIGVGADEMYLGSDALGLAPLTDQVIYLEDGDWVLLSQRSYQIFDDSGHPVERKVVHVPTHNLMVAKNSYPHFMLKEIYEQPGVVGDTLSSLLDTSTRLPSFDHLGMALTPETPINLVACGTSFYAAQVAKYWIEALARMPVNVDIASEFRYRCPPLRSGGIAIFVSQSGETADTLAALHHAKEQGQYCLAIVNVAESSMARAADGVVITDAGPEIGVASTKAFTCQLTVLLCLALYVGQRQGRLAPEQQQSLVNALIHLPSTLQETLQASETFQELAQDLARATSALYLGRGLSYPLALEGALKLKELSYIHAEGFAAGEMKHGPIALIDEKVPVVVLAPVNALFEKTLSNTHEVLVRGAAVIFLSDAQGCARVKDIKGIRAVELPLINEMLTPLVYTLPLQLLAYYTAVSKGTDVDQPRNLAKSVTVE